MPELWGGFEYQKDYELIADIFLIKVSSALEPKRLALSPEGKLFQEAGLYETPKTIENYKKDTQGVATNVVGIVNTGTRIRSKLLHQNKGFTLWFGFHNGLTRYAKIIDGPYAGNIVEIEDIGRFCRDKCDRQHDPILKEPDPRLLREIPPVIEKNSN